MRPAMPVASIAVGPLADWRIVYWLSPGRVRKIYSRTSTKILHDDLEVGAKVTLCESENAGLQRLGILGGKAIRPNSPVFDSLCPVSYHRLLVTQLADAAPGPFAVVYRKCLWPTGIAVGNA